MGVAVVMIIIMAVIVAMMVVDWLKRSALGMAVQRGPGQAVLLAE